MNLLDAVEMLLTDAARLIREDEDAFWLATDAMIQAHCGAIEQPEVVCGRYLWKGRYDIHSMYPFSNTIERKVRYNA